MPLRNRTAEGCYDLEMGKRQPLEINGEVFNTKAAVRKYIRGVKELYADGVPLAPPHQAFVLDLASRHRLINQKIGCGVSHLVIRSVPPFKTRAVYFVRTDGTDVEISLEECLNSSPQWRRFQNACREAIHDQVEGFLARTFEASETVQCSLSGDIVTRQNYNVDHEAPFLSLVENFVALNRIDVDHVEIGGDRDHETRDFFLDSQLRRAFEDFHRENARLRITTKDANLRRKRKAEPSDGIRS